jgi:uncharacterized protein (TIGR02271 family)
MSIGDKLKSLLHGGDWHEDERFRERHRAGGGNVEDYDRLRPAYQYGYSAGSDPSYRGHGFDEVEAHLRRHWTDDLVARSGDWETVRPHVYEAYRSAQDAVATRPQQELVTRPQQELVTRSEEELAIGRRQVPAGEVELRKAVETEHVRREVPVTREEVTVERRPVVEGQSAADIPDDAIRIPIVEEEIVVEKRPVVREELIVRKHLVQDTELVETDVRRERVDIDDRTHGRGSRDDLRDSRDTRDTRDTRDR